MSRYKTEEFEKLKDFIAPFELSKDIESDHIIVIYRSDNIYKSLDEIIDKVTLAFRGTKIYLNGINREVQKTIKLKAKIEDLENELKYTKKIIKDLIK